MTQDELILETQVKKLAEEIEEMKQATQKRIANLRQKRELYLRQIEPSAEALAAKARLETLIKTLMGSSTVVPTPQLTPVQEQPSVAIENNGHGFDADDWLAEPAVPPVTSPPQTTAVLNDAHIPAVNTPSSDDSDDWLSSLSVPSTPTATQNDIDDDFW